MAQQPVSLEKPIGEEEESELGDFVEDQTAESPFEIASENLRRENVRRALAALPTREREVIEMRFGLTGERPRTLEEVGQAFNVTRERIRQIENHTLKKLEALPEAQRLRDALADRLARIDRHSGGIPERSKGRAVNHVAQPSQVRILLPPSSTCGATALATSSSWRRSSPSGHR